VVVVGATGVTGRQLTLMVSLVPGGTTQEHAVVLLVVGQDCDALAERSGFACAASVVPDAWPLACATSAVSASIASTVWASRAAANRAVPAAWCSVA
jgi:hypothetical protein